MPSSTITSNIYYKDTLFKRSNLTPIRGKPTFKTLHKLWNKIKETSSLSTQILEEDHTETLVWYSRMRSTRSYTQLLLSNQLTRVLSSYPDSTTAHANSNMNIAHTE